MTLPPYEPVHMLRSLRDSGPGVCVETCAACVELGHDALGPPTGAGDPNAPLSDDPAHTDGAS